MDLKELFSRKDHIKAEYKGVLTIHHLRDPSPEEDLLYRRKCAGIRVSNGRAESTDTALNAPIWLYDTITDRVLVENGDGQEDLPDFKTVIPNDLKLAIIAAWQNRFEIITKDKET
jgi:hypothetical protein